MLAGICQLMQNTTVAKSRHLFIAVQPILSESHSSYTIFVHDFYKSSLECCVDQSGMNINRR